MRLCVGFPQLGFPLVHLRVVGAALSPGAELPASLGAVTLPGLAVRNGCVAICLCPSHGISGEMPWDCTELVLLLAWLWCTALGQAVGSSSGVSSVTRSSGIPHAAGLWVALSQRMALSVVMSEDCGVAAVPVRVIPALSLNPHVSAALLQELLRGKRAVETSLW